MRPRGRTRAERRVIAQAAAQASTGPFAALSLIVAPAILTNACTVLIMSTSNRLARAVDLTRQLTDELESTTSGDAGSVTDRRLQEMEAASARSLLLLQALRAVYASLAGFATATFIALLAVLFASRLPLPVGRTFELIASVAGAVGVGGIVWAAAVLLGETRIAANSLRARVDTQRERFRRTVSR